jgi:general secretion pathway protein D
MRKYWFVIILVCVLAGTSCTWRKDFKLGREASRKKDWDRAVAYLLKALGEKPDNVEYRISLANALISASNHHLLKGKQYREEGQFKIALAAFEKALEYNPENNEARRAKHRLLKKIRELEKQQRQKKESRQLTGKAGSTGSTTPGIDYKKKPYSIKFIKADLKQVFTVLEKTSGVYFIFDEAFKSKHIGINLENVDFMEALEKIMLQTNLFYKVIDAKTLMIIPDTPAKRREYEELVMKTVFLSSGDPEGIEKIVRSLTGMKTIAVYKELNAITFKGLPEEVKMAEKIVRIHDKPKGELFVDIEIIEVNRSRAQEYGIELSQYQLTETYLPETGTDTASSTSTIRLHRVGHTDSSDYLLTLPSIHYKLLRADRDSRIKARPQLRVLNGRKAEVHLGDKVPIPTTSFVPYNVQGPAQQPITSYQLQDIGINIELTPTLHHDGLITLELKFELTFITSPGTERLPPTLGNRSVSTLIKLRDNETGMLAGLLRDTERKTLSGFPLLSSVPVLKEIFSGNRNEIEQTDIILTLTPRIIRFPEIEAEDQELYWVGTQERPGLKPPPFTLKLEPEEEPGEEPIKEEQKKQNPTQPKLTLVFPAEGRDMKKDIEAEVPLTLSGDGEIRAIALEMDFDPGLIRVLDVLKGEALNQPGVNCLLLRNIDNQTGKLQINISLEQPVKITAERTGITAEWMVFRLKPAGTGVVRFRPVSVHVLDANMKEVESECPETGMTFRISK